MESANGAFISNTLTVNSEYERNLKKYYKADIKKLDYSDRTGAANVVNHWVRNITHGWIGDIVNPGKKSHMLQQNRHFLITLILDTFSSGSGLILANALYFKGLWKIVFDERSTSIKCFRNHRKNCVNARMMQTADTFNYKFINDLDSQALQLQYGVSIFVIQNYIWCLYSTNINTGW